MDEKNTNNTQDSNQFEEQARKKPKKGTRKKFVLSKKAVSAIYLGIAFCMVTVLTISIASTNNKVNNSIENIGDLSISVPDISIVIPSENNASKPDNKPTGQEASGVVADVDDPDESKTPVATTSYVLPVDGEIIKGCYLDSLVFSDTMQDFRTHNGVDLQAQLGEKVVAYTNGIVSKVEEHPFMGTSIELTHSGGVVSVYRNLEKDVFVEVGQEIKAGELIGKVGNTALLEIAEQPHLHFEIWMNGECINSEAEIKALLS